MGFNAGPQRKIEGDSHKVSLQKNIDAGSSSSGGFNKKSGTRSADFKSAPSANEDWAGVKGGGKSKHTYGVDGENDFD